MAKSGVQQSVKVDEAAWIGGRLSPFDSGVVTSVVPSGFEAYTRVLHPLDPQAPGQQPGRWIDVASWSGIGLVPGVDFPDIALPEHEPSGPEPWPGQVPQVGTLHRTDADALYPVRARHRRPLLTLAFRGVVHWNLRVIHRFRRELREWGALAFAGYAAFAYGVVAVAAYLWLPGVLLAGDSFRGDAERATAFTDARGSVLQLLAGLVVLAGAYLTARTLRLNRAGHISDRFSKGVDQLGHVEIQTRVGGVYALERVMRDAPLEQRAVLETLVAFLRERRALSGVQLSAPDPTNAIAPPPDAAAALRVIGRRRVANDPEGPEDFGWNLTEFDLRDFSLRSGNFSGVNLWRTDLRRANLKGADLSGVKGFNQAVLADAVYDEGTRFPTGFDPAARGLRMAQDSTAAPGEPVA